MDKKPYKTEFSSTSDIYAELGIRLIQLTELLEYCTKWNSVPRVLYKLINSGPQRFSDLERIGVSSRTLSKALSRLIEDGWVDQVNDKYRALVPEWIAIQK